MPSYDIHILLSHSGGKKIVQVAPKLESVFKRPWTLKYIIGAKYIFLFYFIFYILLYFTRTRAKRKLLRVTNPVHKVRQPGWMYTYVDCSLEFWFSWAVLRLYEWSGNICCGDFLSFAQEVANLCLHTFISIHRVCIMYRWLMETMVIIILWFLR